MRLAAIDIGTNSLHMIVVQVALIFRSKSSTGKKRWYAWAPVDSTAGR